MVLKSTSPKGHTAAGHKFLFEGRFPPDCVGVVEQGVDQLVSAFFAQFHPRAVGIQAGLFEQVLPEILWQVKWAGIGQLLFVGIRCCGFHDCGHLFPVGKADPVDLDGKAVAPLLQFACAPCRKLEYRWAAHAPMCDQDRPLVGQLGALYSNDGVLNDQAHALGDGFTGHVEGEQRRHGFTDGMA